MKGYIVKFFVLFFCLNKVMANSDFAPDTLEGKTLQITESTNDNEFKSEFYFTLNKAYYQIPLSNTFKEISYDYNKSIGSPSNATLKLLGRDEGDVIHEIVFSSTTTAQSNWTDDLKSGDGELSVSEQNFVPISLSDFTLSGSSTNDIFKFGDSNQALYYDSFADNFSDRKLSRITYNWEQNGSRIGKLTSSLGETLFLFFESNTDGYFYWTETVNEKDRLNGPFDLNEVSGGYAYDSLVGSSITIEDTVYSFISSSATEIQTASGSTSKEFSYLKNSYNEALLFVDPNLYRLDFHSINSGMISEGGEGTFQISHNTATKGWVFNSFFPWVYSNKLGSWYYQGLFSEHNSNKTEMAYFQSWRNSWTKNDDLEFNNRRVFALEPQKNYPKGWLWTEHLPWAFSFETGGWLYIELAKDVDCNPVMNYYDYETESWDLYGPSLISLIK